jgi:hypothetical protein
LGQLDHQTPLSKWHIWFIVQLGFWFFKLKDSSDFIRWKKHNSFKINLD